MQIEAVGKTLTYRWPHGEVRLEPGKPVELPDDRARKILQKAPGKVRRCAPDWLNAWRQVRDMTHGITSEDPRLPAILAAIDRCDSAFAAGDWEAFQKAAARVRQATS